MSRIAEVIAGAKMPHPDPEVRAARVRGHEAFDPLWQETHWSRSQAYAWLHEQMGYNFHFGHCDDVAEIERAIEICEDKQEDMGLW